VCTLNVYTFDPLLPNSPSPSSFSSLPFTFTFPLSPVLHDKREQRGAEKVRTESTHTCIISLRVLDPIYYPLPPLPSLLSSHSFLAYLTHSFSSFLLPSICSSLIFLFDPACPLSSSPHTSLHPLRSLSIPSLPFSFPHLYFFPSPLLLSIVIAPG
jgi:hypothetical protein